MARTPPTNKQNKSTGRSVKYRPLFAHQAYLLCRNHGYTDPQLAEVLDVSLATLQAWKRKYAPLREAIQADQEVFGEERVETALLKCATDFVRQQITTKTIRWDGQEYIETVEVREEVPGDVRTQMFWLCNRNPRRWQRLSQTAQEAEPNEGTRGALVVPEPEDPDAWLRRVQSQDP